jgi:predicted carbohydrate-binding protein with CBM5 and CBM33 domain
VSENVFSFTGSILSVAAVLTLSAASAHSQLETPVAGTSEGEKLERQMSADIKAKNWQAVENRIAEGFQSVHPDGARDRAGEIALLKSMNLGEFTLSDFKSTMIGDNIVVTFTMTVAETIDGKRLPAKPAYRLSVWKRGENGWQWISHANLTPIR